jgi:hypothetical protein
MSELHSKLIRMVRRAKAVVAEMRTRDSRDSM